MLAQVVGGFTAILIGLSLLGPITQIVNDTATNSTLVESSAWGATLLKFVPGFFALAILGMGIAVCYSALKNAGILGDEDYREDYNEAHKDPNHKQTYEEYVQERLRVEKEMR